MKRLTPSPPTPPTPTPPTPPSPRSHSLVAPINTMTILSTPSAVSSKSRNKPPSKMTTILGLTSLMMLLIAIAAGQLALARPPQLGSASLTRTRHPITIDETNWRLLLEGEWIIQLYAPSCTSCKRLEPDWRRLAESVASVSDSAAESRGPQQHHLSRLGVASADVTANPAIMTRFMVKNLPTIYHIKDGVFRLYTGPLNYAALVRFIEDLAWQHIEPTPLNISQPGRQSIALAATALLPRPTPQQQQFSVMAGNKSPLNQQQQSQNNPYTNATHAILLDLRQQLITRAMKFDEHFRNLLTKSKLSLHNMFVATYGMMYEHNTEIFTSMYESLEQYYATGRVELTKSMESFFQRLYQKIFQVANSNRVFSPTYLECVTEQLTHLKPFKDAPDKLIVDIRHALVAARTFNQALNSAIDIIKSIISLADPPQCINLINEKLLRNQQQPTGGTTRELLTTSGNGQAPNTRQQPCLNFCEQVILRCVGRANLEPLADRWRSYVVALSELAKKLSVQYNIETIIGPIDVQISEAIMNFQENSHNITERVYAACGDAKPNNGLQPTLSNVAPTRAPGHNLLGKREAIVSRAPTTVSSPNSFGYNSQQQQQLSQATNNRRNLQPANGLRQTDGIIHSIVPTSPVEYEQAGANSSPRVFASSSTNQMIADHSQSSSNGIHSQSSGSMFDSYEDVPGSPLVAFNRKSPVIIGEIKDYLLSTKNFWSSLPNSVCNITLGASVGSNNYLRRNSQNCFHEALEVYDMNSDLRYRLEIQHQIQRLDSMYSKISDALHGVEIDWSKMSDTAAGAPSIVPMDFQQQQSIPNRQPQQVAGVQLQRPYVPQQTSKPGTVSDEEEDPDEPIDDDESGSGSNIEDTDDEYLSNTSPSDDDDDIDPHEEESTETNDELPPTTQSTDLTSDDAVSTIENNTIENDQKTQMILNQQSNDLITADSMPRKSGASLTSGSLIVIDKTSLLLISIIYCALSVVIQNKFRPVTLIQG